MPVIRVALQGLGHSRGHRHRLCGRRAGAARRPRCPPSLKIFLLALGHPRRPRRHRHHRRVLYRQSALGALLPLAGGGAARLLCALNRARRDAAGALSAHRRVRSGCACLKSGVHATLAGVVVAAASSRCRQSRAQPSLLEQLEESLHPWIAFGDLAAVRLRQRRRSRSRGCRSPSCWSRCRSASRSACSSASRSASSAASWLAVMAAASRRSRKVPAGAQLLGVGMLGGIGFTMSLFIGTLAFPDPAPRRAAAPRRARWFAALGGCRLSGTALQRACAALIAGNELCFQRLGGVIGPTCL